MAAAGFVVALGHFRDAPLSACDLAHVHGDPAYAVKIADQAIASDGFAYRLNVTRDGEALRGAQVCLKVHPDHRPAVGVTNPAREIGSGQYDVPPAFDPPGLWRGQVVVVDAGHGAVAVPLSFRVSLTVQPGQP